LLLAAICLSSIGLATSMTSLSVIYVLGMIGVGIFHPVGASSMGQLAATLPGSRRSLGVSFFFVAGMLGGITGSLIAPRIAAQPGGFHWLRYAMIPGLLVAAMLHLAIARVPHRDHQVPARAAGETARRWRMVGLLYCSNAMRFTVNMTLFYLFIRWAQAAVRETGVVAEAEVAAVAAPINGNLVALVVLGMAVGGLIAGSTVRPGREKLPLVLVPICFAPAIAGFGRASVPVGYLLAVAAGIGFAAMIPVTISLSQRLLPNRTSLASGLMLGGAWSLAVLGPVTAEFCLHSLDLTLETTFTLTAVLLALSGLVCCFLSPAALRDEASE
jgi:FSR family fosmidomycin resistance protein-like MFS transporter